MIIIKMYFIIYKFYKIYISKLKDIFVINCNE